MDNLLMILVVGLIATLMMDFWQILVKMAFKFPATDWGLVGRWVANIPKGGLLQGDIRKVPEKKAENAVGIIFHYGVGLIFAALYLYIAATPTLYSGIAFGIMALVAPWFVLQPGMGLGVFATKSPKPLIPLAHNFTSHLFFGAGLYLGFRVFLSMGI